MKKIFGYALGLFIYMPITFILLSINYAILRLVWLLSKAYRKVGFYRLADRLHAYTSKYR